MPPGSYSDVFGGSNIYPSQPSYLLINPLTVNILLDWPIEQSLAGNLTVADIIDVNATAGGLSIQLSSALEVSTGYTALFNNIGANTFTVLDNTGGVIATVASGTVWQIYLSDNTTVAGTWRVFQFGAGASSANAAALAGAGLIAITTTLNQNYVVKPESANYVSTSADRAEVLEWTGGTGTLTLPSAVTVTSGWFVLVKNSGSGIWTASAPGGQTIDASPSLGLNPEQSCFIVSDGANFFTIGLGQQLNSVFDFIQIDLTGATGNVVLSGAQLNRISYRFTGALAGNVNIIVPNTIQQYWVDNETTGAFSLTVKTAAGTGISVGQGSRNILYSDGTNVTNAVTFGSTGFSNGTAAAPSIFFTASPQTGFYSPGTDQLASTTAGVQRFLIDATGHITLNGATTNATPTLTINGQTAIGGVAARITSPFSSIAATPLLHLQSTASNGFATFSLSGNSGVPGTNDLAIFQNGSTLDCTVMNRAAAALNLATNGLNRLTIDNTGQVAITPTGGVGLTINTVAGGVYGLQVNPGAGSIAAHFTAGTVGTPALQIDLANTTGAQAVNFTGVTSKPGVSGGGPSTWMAIGVGAAVFWIPMWSN